MMFSAGTRLGMYEILSPLGAGGMGEVWRATDTKLGREVALKLLPEDFSNDPDRHARFEHEAKILASLNHPNIAILFGLEHLDGKHVLVMELVDGEGLDSMITRGPIPAEEAIPIALQIAEALESAHEAGIVHRDLKPANIMLDEDGTVKVLDFGLAKAWETDGSDSSLSLSPTMTRNATLEGVILGTAAYMSPEQARGKKVDRRADIWAFGVVLWEMLTGHELFKGETVSDTLAAVLTREPDFAELPKATPRKLKELLSRCLRRDPKTRRRDIGDIRVDLSEILETGGDEAVAGAVSSGRRTGYRTAWTVAAIAVVASAVLGTMQLKSGPPETKEPVHLSVSLPNELVFSVSSSDPVVAISPSGLQIALTAESGGVSQIYLRSLDSTGLVPLEGTEGGNTPFFSPNGRSVGFTSGDRKLKKVSIDSGQLTTLADADWGGGSWGADGTIIYTPKYIAGLWKVSELGGDAVELTKPDPTIGELNHSWPDHIAGTRSVLFTSFRLPLEESRLEIYDLDSGARRILVENAVFGRFLSSGHVVFVRNGTMFAAPIDVETLEFTQPPVPVIDDCYVAPFEGNSQFAVSENGTLLNIPGSVLEPPRNLLWVDREGREEIILEADRRYGMPALSPDGTRVALTIADGNPDLWIFDLGRQVLNRLTYSPRSEFSPRWFPDGRKIAFILDEPPFNIWTVPADGSAQPTALLKSPDDSYPESISPDGRWMAVRESRSGSGYDLDLVRLTEDPTEPQILRQTPFREAFASFSPDGRFVAYVANETGRNEIFVQAFPDPGARIQVSGHGGDIPLWGRNGEVFFWDDGNLFATRIETVPELSIGQPKILFSFDLHTGWINQGYDVSADGQRFILTRTPSASKPREIQVVLNWFTELERLAGPGQAQ